MNTWNNSDDFYIRVRGRNGNFNADADYTLTVTQLPGTCSQINPITVASDTPVLANNYQTIILTDWSRLPGTATETQVLQDRLTTLAARSEVAGVVIDVGADAKVAAANAQANSHPECPYAKNLVAEAIKEIIDAHRAANPLAYVVLIGNDDTLPFFRDPDNALLANEDNYVPPVRDFTASQASLRLGYILSQDRYGSTVDVSFKANNIPIPDLAVGRLVESAADATTLIDAYLTTTDGVVDTPLSSLVTGYDFLADSSRAIQMELAAGLGTGSVNNALITDRDASPMSDTAWSADDLRPLLLNNRHDIMFLAGHFSANSALAADYSTRLTADELADAPADLTNTIIFSAGCHTGYNIVDTDDIPGVTGQPDWAQAFTRKGATLIAGTGYQYGDTDFIEYNERLYLEFSRQLRMGNGPVSVGQALVAAKQKYLNDTPKLLGLHEKALLETTLFGLPMLRVDLPGERLTPDTDTSIVSTLTPAGANPGVMLGLQTADVSVTPSLTEQSVNLTNVQDKSSVMATYLTGSDTFVTKPVEPALPLEIRNVSTPGTVLRGIGFRAGGYTDQPDVTPLIGAPTTEIRGVHAPFFSNIFFPITPWRINYFDALTQGGATRLMVTPVQHKSSAPGLQTTTRRQFNSLDFRLYYSDNVQTYANQSVPALSAPPAIIRVQSDPQGGQVNFQVTVVGNPAAGIQAVWVTYTANQGGFYSQWASLDLSQNQTDSRLWTGSLDLQGANPADVQFMVQAVNGVGLVSVDTNQGAYYTPGVDPGATTAAPNPATITLESAPPSGAYGTPVTFQARLTSNGQAVAGQLLTFSFGNQKRQAFTGANGQAAVTTSLLTLPGQYQLIASFAGDATYNSASDSAPLTITKQDTVLSLEPPQTTIEEGSDAVIVATLTDITGRRLREQTLFFVLQSNGELTVVPLITDYAGRATLPLNTIPVGSYNLTVYFNGTIPTPDGGSSVLDDSRYNDTTANGSIEVVERKQELGLLDFCLFAFYSHLKAGNGSSINCDVGSNSHVFLQTMTTVNGDILAIEEHIVVGNKTHVTGDLTAGLDITLKNKTIISGNLKAGRNINLHPNATVLGTVTPNADLSLEPIASAPFSVSPGDDHILVHAHTPLTLEPGAYGKLIIRPGATLHLTSGAYTFKSILGGQRAKIILDIGEGPLTVDVLETVSLSSHATMQTDGEAANILFRVWGRIVKLNNRGEYLGTYYAPNAKITLGTQAHLQGVLYGKQIFIRRDAQVVGAPASTLLEPTLTE